MKNVSYFFVLSLILLQSCTYQRKKVTRTVSKVINLTFSVNQAGNFQAFQRFDNRDIIDVFDRTSSSVVSAEIERIDIRGVKIGAEIIKPTNTATQVTLSADVWAGALLNQPTRLLNETKTISIGGSGIDFGNILGNAIGTSENITLHNALTILNSQGAAELKKILTENLKGINQGGFTIRLNGTVPANQRLAMSLTIAIDASITFTRCEEILVMNFNPLHPASTGDDCN